MDTYTDTVPVPDGTTWTDIAGGEWTSHGDDITITFPVTVPTRHVGSSLTVTHTSGDAS